MAKRWSEVLDIAAPAIRNEYRATISKGALNFSKADTDRITDYQLSVRNPLASARQELTICGTRFHLLPE